MKHAIAVCCTALLGALSCAFVPTAGADEAAGPRDITWDDLVPEGWTPPEQQIDHFFDASPPPAASLADTPVVQAMDQQHVRLPGYLVPLDVEENRLKTFLMVPYFGACIHVPPPPPNQVVYVEMSDPVTVEDPYGAHWVTGIMSTTASTTNLAEASYTLSGESVEVFDWDQFYEQQQADEAAAATN
jgi:hypothetical protein